MAAWLWMPSLAQAIRSDSGPSPIINSTSPVRSPAAGNRAVGPSTCMSMARFLVSGGPEAFGIGRARGAVAPGRLARVQRGVGAFEQAGHRFARDQLGHADAERGGDAGIGHRQGPAADRHAHALGDPQRRLRVMAGQHHQELVAAVAAERIAAAQLVAPAPGHDAQALVADAVAPAVVALLAAVDVDEGARQRGAASPRARDLLAPPLPG